MSEAVKTMSYPGQYNFEGIPLLENYQSRDLVEKTLKLKVFPTDVLLMGYPKTGTTWLQELLWLICHNADTDTASKISVKQRVPSLELRFSTLEGGVDLCENIQSPRILKSHLPIKYWKERIQDVNPKVVVIMRNPKDTVVSYFHFIRTVHPRLASMTWNQYFHNIQVGNVIYGDCLDHMHDWWEACGNMDNVMFVKYEDMKEDPVGSIEKLAKFLEMHLEEGQVLNIANHTSFSKMKTNPATNWSNITDINQHVSSFYRKGQIGDWKTLFTQEQNIYFDEQIELKLGQTGLTFRYE